MNEKINEKTKGEDIDAFRTPASFQGIEVVFGSAGSGTTASKGHLNTSIMRTETETGKETFEFVGCDELYGPDGDEIPRSDASEHPLW